MAGILTTVGNGTLLQLFDGVAGQLAIAGTRCTINFVFAAAIYSLFSPKILSLTLISSPVLALWLPQVQ